MSTIERLESAVKALDNPRDLKPGYTEFHLREIANALPQLLAVAKAAKQASAWKFSSTARNLELMEALALLGSVK